MKVVTVEFHSRRRQVTFWVCVAVVGFIVAAGPYLATALIVRGAQQSQANSQANSAQIRTLQRTDEGVQSLLKFVASVQSGGQDQTSGWYVKEFLAICAAVNCHGVPLPPALARQVAP